MNTTINNVTEMFLSIITVQIFVVIASSLSGLVNGLIIGNYLSQTAMAALGLVIPMTSFLAGISTIVSGGAGILCGNYMGRGDKKKINQVYSSSIIMLVVVGIVLTVIGIVFAEPLAYLFGATSETVLDTAIYIRGISIGTIPTLLLPCIIVFLQMCNKSTFSLILTILMAVFNALFCLADIHLLNGNIFGIGIATSLSKYATLLIALIYLQKHKELIEFKMNLFDKRMVLDITRIGSPSSLAGILYSIRNVFINKFAAATAGTIAVNSLAILSSCGGFFDAFNIGVISTLTMLASVFIGEKDSDSLKKLIKTTCIIGLSFAFIKLVVVYAFGRNIVMAFGADTAVADSATRLLQLYTWSAPLNIITGALVGINQNLGRVSFCNVMYMFNCIITPLLCCVFLSRYIGIDGVYSCYYIAEIVTISIIYCVSCIKAKKLITNLNDLFSLDKTLNNTEKYSMTIRNTDDVINLSEKIEEFLKANGIDSRRAMFAGLCMEEMSGNVVEHGFIKDNKENTVDAFVHVENDEITLRLRDNCVPFDPNSRKDIVDPEDPCKNIGIRMISKIAKEMNYQSTFGMNVLTIKL